MGADKAAGEIESRIDHLLPAVEDTPRAGEEQGAALRALKARMQDLRVQLNGDTTVASRAEPTPLSLRSRVSFIAGGSWGSQSAVTGNFSDSYQVAAEQFPAILSELESIAGDLADLEAELEQAGAPWTPARIPDWKP